MDARNHVNDSGDLVIAQKTLFRQVGWKGHSGHFYPLGESPSDTEPGGFSPIFQQIATWSDGGWAD